ncbi:hypothetical protein SCHPADRAFT_999065 [Schizopora paradoxa]|uniref:F-box domain-containing protein n=1 Tax=Schizopora paradoxa TaxID=27342 RepID=A0A0H2RP43_9AGAM|nr:hypothetical protein SCHPADRAFT_999065 [Schizopora paradoxa]
MSMSTNPSTNLSTFPPDILIHIYRHVCALPEFKNIEDVDDADRRPGVMDLECISPSSPEIVLSCICRSWRCLMLSMPSFWTVLCVGTPRPLSFKSTEPAPTAKALGKQTELLKIWAKRSDGRPLSVVVRLEQEAGNEEDRDAALHLVYEVRRLSERWEFEFLSVRCHDYLVSFLSSCAFDRFTSRRIQQVELIETGPSSYGFQNNRAPSRPCVLKYQAACMRLEKLKIQGGLDLQMENLFIPTLNVHPITMNLTCFIYRQPPRHRKSFPMTFDDALILLAHCQSLKTFDFAATNDFLFEDDIPDYLPNWNDEEHVLRLNLTRLSLSSTKALDFGPLLSLLAAPDLEELSLTGPYYAEWMIDEHDMNYNVHEDWNHVTEFLDRVESPLRKLHLEGMPLTSESVVGYLEQMDSIEDLKVDGRIFDRYLVSRLTWMPDAEDSNNLLPELKSLTVVGCSISYLSIIELVHMIYSRARYLQLFSIDDDVENLVVHEQLKQWTEDKGPANMDMVRLTDTKDNLDILESEWMQKQFMMNPILLNLATDGCFHMSIE